MFFLGFVALIMPLSACESVATDRMKNGQMMLSYQNKATIDNSAGWSPHAFKAMHHDALKACPEGYQIKKEYEVVDPPDNSRHVWEINCQAGRR